MGDTSFYSTRQWLVQIWTARTSATLSILGSALICYMILRRRKVRLGLLHNRLLFAMSIFDMFNSSSLAVGTAASPADCTDEFYQQHTFGPPYGAQGNSATCSAQGFFFSLGHAVPIYNCCLCINYVAVIRYNVKDDTLKSFEPLMHLVACLFPLSEAILGVALDLFHPTGGLLCWLPPTSDEHKFVPIFKLCVILTSLIVFLIIVITMWGVVATVRKQEKCMEEYQNLPITRGPGIGPRLSLSGAANLTLQVDTNNNNNNNNDGSNNNNNAQNRISTPMSRRNSNVPPNTGTLGSKEVLIQASLYFGAFLSTWLIGSVVTIIGDHSFILAFFNSLLIPLQGAWNCVAFIRPKYIALRAKNPNKSATWALRKSIVSSVEEEDLIKRQERRRSSFLLDLKRRRSSMLSSTPVPTPSSTPINSLMESEQQQLGGHNIGDTVGSLLQEQQPEKRDMDRSKKMNAKANHSQLECDTDEDNIDSDDTDGCKEYENICLEEGNNNKPNHINFLVSTTMSDDDQKMQRNRWNKSKIPSPLNESR